MRAHFYKKRQRQIGVKSAATSGARACVRARALARELVYCLKAESLVPPPLHQARIKEGARARYRATAWQATRGERRAARWPLAGALAPQNLINERRQRRRARVLDRAAASRLLKCDDDERGRRATARHSAAAAVAAAATRRSHEKGGFKYKNKKITPLVFAAATRRLREGARLENSARTRA